MKAPKVASSASRAHGGIAMAPDSSAITDTKSAIRQAATKLGARRRANPARLIPMSRSGIPMAGRNRTSTVTEYAAATPSTR